MTKQAVIITLGAAYQAISIENLVNVHSGEHYAWGKSGNPLDHAYLLETTACRPKIRLPVPPGAG